MLVLKGSIQKYAWGKLGPNSEAALLMQSLIPEYEIEEETPYAELWIGTHINGPAIIIDSSSTTSINSLTEWIALNPDSLGFYVTSKFGPQLPFLLKVLSINKALSIQAHPDKKLASVLNKNNPQNYPDFNHKPEMAIALTHFEGLCGFKPIEKIIEKLNTVEELSNLIGPNLISNLKEAKEDDKIKLCLKAVYTTLMKTPDEKINSTLSLLIQRLHKTTSLSDDDNLLLKINKDFSCDVGLLSVYFLNYVVLQPGEAMCINENEPHAYLFGDCVECMACSDNVVRAGLTPKFKDVSVLCEMLTYNTNDSAFICRPSASIYSFTYEYLTPMEEFVIHKIEMNESEVTSIDGEFDIPALKTASILLIIYGTMDITVKNNSNPFVAKRGSILYISCDESLKGTLVSTRFLAFRAFTPYPN